MRHEVDRAIGAHGMDAFRIELLWPAVPRRIFDTPPFYERHGEKRVATGRYAEVIRYEQHVLPLKRLLLEHVASLTGGADVFQ